MIMMKRTMRFIGLVLFILFLVLFFSFGILRVCYGKTKEILIPMPDPCYYVSKIEKNKIYLERREDRVCTMVVSFTKVEVDIQEGDCLEIYAGGRLWLKSCVREGIIDDIVERMFYAANSTKAYLEKGSIKPREDIMKEAERYALESYNYYQSEEFQSKVKSYSDFIRGSLIGNGTYSGLYSKSDVKKVDRLNMLKEGKKLKLSENERIYIFVSSGMPIEVVRNYVKQATELFDYQDLASRVFFVLRGGVDGLRKVSSTVDWVLSVISKDGKGCLSEDCEIFPVNFIIDPFLYRKYNIFKVPAIVYVEGLFGQELGLVSEGSNSIQIGRGLIRYGDVSLYRHLEKIFEVLEGVK